MVKNEMGGGNASSYGKFRRERTREKFRRLKFQPVPPSSHNRDLRKLLRGRWREVRSKENRESSTAKRDFHPFYLLFFFSSLLFSFLFFLLLPPPFARRDRIALSNTPPVSPPPSLFHHWERKRGREKRKRGRKIVNTAIKRGTETKEGESKRREGKGLENCEEEYAKRRER